MSLSNAQEAGLLICLLRCIPVGEYVVVAWGTVCCVVRSVLFPVRLVLSPPLMSPDFVQKKRRFNHE